MHLRCLLPLVLACLPTLAMAVQQYGYRVTDQKPQSRDNHVQGLEIVDGYLYVSTGRYRKSHLLRYHFADGALETSRKVDDRIWGEGLTVFGDRVYQLTYRNRIVLVYNKENLEPQGWFRIPGEGWGLTHNGEDLIYSDGSDKLHFLSPQTLRITRSVSVRENGAPVPRLNELEWVDGKVWANVWMTDRIVVIEPDSGEVTASIDLQGLLPATEPRKSDELLNGIARNPADGTIWVTGKRWPWLYQIELVPAKDAKQAPPAADSR